MKNTFAIGLCVAVLALAAPTLFAAPHSPEFYKTTNSDDWVAHTFKIQAKYDHVLVVTAGEAPKKVSIPALVLNGGSAAYQATLKAEGSVPPLTWSLSEEYSVTASYKTLQEAADAAQGGDLVLVMPGTYAGFALGDKESCSDGKYIHFKAYGKPGDVIIDRPAQGKDRNWMVMFACAHHAILEGFNLVGASGPGQPEVRTQPQSGIFIGGDIVETGKLAHHIVILNNFSHNHRGWGLHSVETHTVLMQGNCFALSCREHSAYVSDGSDNYCIRGNVFFGSSSSGLQCNLDPGACLSKLVRIPALAEFRDAPNTPEIAQKILKAATAIYGANNFPDGQGTNFIIEDNVINENGRKGGGSLNLAGLKDSLIQNNLIYDNLTTGIAMWDNGNPWDAPLVSPGPSSPKGVTPESLPFWGCQRNTIRNNTIVMNVKGRPGIGLANGSWGNILRNNISLNDLQATLELSNTSIYKLDSGYNVLNKIDSNDMPEEMKTLAVNLDEKNHSILDVTREKALAEFVKAHSEPWIVIEGNWWKLNPNRPDFHPKKDSKLFVGTGDAANMPAGDIDAASRKSADTMGAYIIQ